MRVAARKAARLGGLRLIFLIRRLGLHSALDGPPWLLPDPWLHDILRYRVAPDLPQRPGEPWPDYKRRARPLIRVLKNLHRMAGGRVRIRRSVRLCWA